MNGATHPVAPEEVMALLDGELSPERTQAVSTHLRDCAACQKIQDSFRYTSQALAEWKVPALPERIAERLSKDSVSIKNPADQYFLEVGRFFGRRSTWAWVGAALVLLFLGLSFRQGKYMNQYVPSTPGRELVVVTKPGKSGPPTQTVTAGRRTPGDSLSKFTDKLQVPEAGRLLVQGKMAGSASQPMIARAVSLTTVVKDFDAGRTSLEAILARHNGYAANLSVSTPDGAARLIQASLRIPAAQLDFALRELKALGRVEEERQNGEEVTEQHADLVARLKNSRETEQRLQDVLRTRTGKVKDVLEVEQEISRVRGEIEQMEAQQKTLEHRVDFATIDLKLVEEYRAQLSAPTPSVWMQLRNATINGFRNAFENLLGIVLFLAESGPSLLLWLVILGFPGWLVWRRYRLVHARASFGEILR